MFLIRGLFVVVQWETVVKIPGAEVVAANDFTWEGYRFQATIPNSFEGLTADGPAVVKL